MGIKVKFVTATFEKKICIDIRREVFIKEQNIPEELEMDDSRIIAKSYVALYKKNYVGTARYRETESGIKLERFAVLKQYRNLGVGKALVNCIINSLSSESKIYLHAQEQVVEFYTKLGFEKIGERFLEAGVPHFKLIRQ